MGQQRSNLTLSRQWEAIQLLPDRAPGMSVVELGARLRDKGFDVRKRTVQRDLDALSTTLPIKSNNERGREHYWLQGGWHQKLPPMSVAHAVSHRMIEDFIRPLLPKSVLEAIEPSFAAARQKLEALSANNPFGSLVNKIRAVNPALPFVAPAIRADILDTIQQALLNNEICEVHYQRLDADAPTARTLKPLSLVQRGHATYLVALGTTGTSPALYSLQRIHEARLTGDSFTPPDNYSLDDQIQRGVLNFGNGRQLHLVLKLRGDAQGKQTLRQILQETPLTPDMVLTTLEDHTRVEVDIPDTWQLTWWLMSHADEIEVVEPASLRASIRERLMRAGSFYAD